MNVTPQQLRQVTLKEYLEDPIVRQTLKTVKTELDKDKQEVAVLYVNGMIVRGGDRRPGVASAQRICKRKYSRQMYQIHRFLRDCFGFILSNVSAAILRD
jgi:hypothetical protein